MTMSMLLMPVIALALIHPGLAYRLLVDRSIQSSAVCANGFEWMDNEGGMSPCSVAAYVNAACRSGDYTVKALNTSGSGSHYAVLAPDLCSCSWASYNLLSACTVCQNQQNSVQNWAAIRNNCTQFQSNSYFPANTPIQNGQTIPFWAGVDPTTWRDGRFNVDDAQKIADEHHDDLDPTHSSPAPKKSTPIGAIVGSVIGGVAIIVLGVLAAVYIRSRHRSSQTGEVQPSFLQRPGLHGRSFSDLSQKTGTTHQFNPVLETIPNSPTAPTIRTHSSSTHSLSYFGSAQGSVYSMPLQSVGRVLSGTPSLPMGAAPPVPISQDMITPFNINATSPPPPTSPSMTHRKLASESSENAIPVNRTEESSVDGHASVTQRRLNPPAYTASVYESQTTPGQPHTPNLSSSELSAALRREARGHAHRPVRENKGSQDTQTTWDSIGSRNMSQDPGPLANRIALSLAGRGRTEVPPVHNDDDEDLPIA